METEGLPLYKSSLEWGEQRSVDPGSEALLDRLDHKVIGLALILSPDDRRLCLRRDELKEGSQVHLFGAGIHARTVGTAGTTRGHG